MCKSVECTIRVSDLDDLNKATIQVEKILNVYSEKCLY